MCKRLQSARRLDQSCRLDRGRNGRYGPEGFFVEAVSLLELVERVLLERGFDIMQDIVDVVFPGPR